MDAQERARVLWLALQAQSSVDTHQIKIIMNFAAQVEAETWERAANVVTEVRQQEMTGLHNMHYVDACDAILDKLSALSSSPNGPRRGRDERTQP